MWWIIIGIIIFVIYKINKEYKEDVQTHVSNYGGMQNKYSLLVAYLQSSGGFHITRQTKDSLELVSNSGLFLLDYIGCDLEVRMKYILPIYGKIEKKWIFRDGYPQERMITDIELFLNSKMREFGISE